VLPHQLGQNLILTLDLLLQILNAFLLGLVARAGRALESRRPVLEEFLLPAVEYRRLQSEFITELGNWLLLQQMPPQNGYLLFRCIVLPYPFHAFSPLS